MKKRKVYLVLVTKKTTKNRIEIFQKLEFPQSTKVINPHYRLHHHKHNNSQLNNKSKKNQSKLFLHLKI
jgi:hypothetical protein